MPGAGGGCAVSVYRLWEVGVSKTFDPYKIGFTLKVSDETIRKIEKMRAEDAVAARKAPRYVYGFPVQE